MEKNVFDKELVESIMLRPTVEELMASFEHRGYEIVKQTKVDFGDMEWLIITDDFYRMPYIIPTCKYGIAWRTKKLTEYGMIHRAIKPEITPDELLYNMYIDASCFTEIEGGYPVDMIVSLADLALKESIENCRKIAKDNEKNSIIINPAYTGNKQSKGYEAHRYCNTLERVFRLAEKHGRTLTDEEAMHDAWVKLGDHIPENVVRYWRKVNKK